MQFHTPSRSIPPLDSLLNCMVSTKTLLLKHYYSRQGFGVLQNLSSTGFYYVKRSAEPSCGTSKVPQNSGEPLGARTSLSRTGFFPPNGAFLEAIFVESKLLFRYSPDFLSPTCFLKGRLSENRTHCVRCVQLAGYFSTKFLRFPG